MIGVLYTKTFQTALLSTLLFYVLANPDTFKMVKRIPGLKFVMKSTNEITHSGVITHALLFGVVLFLCVLLINKTLVQHFPFLNVVEHLSELERKGINDICQNAKVASYYATYQAAEAMKQCNDIKDTNSQFTNWRGNTPLGDDGNSQNPDSATPLPGAWNVRAAGVPQAPVRRKCSDGVPDEDQGDWCPSPGNFKEDGMCSDYQCSYPANKTICCNS